ncbi:hypothetical protein I4U23_004440 [Adineta vaga]|nr:hypothetical protein I4U23_004440 [Adineta vaga]
MSITETVVKTDDENKQSFTWVDFLTQLDRSLSGDLYNVCYNIINIGLLCIGLYYGLTTCRAPGICAGTVCIFITPQRSPYNDCEIVRFFLGIVCMNTWFLNLIWPKKPSLPPRRSLTFECLILLFWIIITGIYFNFVIFALIETKSYDCIYTHIEDLLFGAPLRSFAGIGLILNGFILVLRIANAILNQLFYRLPKYRKIFIRLSAIDYALSYLMTMVMTYYYSLGVVLLFQPRSGCSCRNAAPDLYQTLFVWELLRLFAPFTILLLVRFVSCFGTLCGTCLGHCLPVSIIVPLFEALMKPSSQSSALPATADTLPLLVFDQVSNDFNKSACTICQTKFQLNEQIKKLPCGHLFHKECGINWLGVTKTCPTCHERITSINL